MQTWKDNVPRYLARLLIFAAVWALLDDFAKWLMPPIETTISYLLGFFGLPSNFSPLNAIVLLVLASAIRHRRRLALWVVIIYFQLATVLLGILIFVFSILGYVDSLSLSDILSVAASILVSLASAIILILARRSFPTKIASGIWWKALALVIFSLIVAVFAGIVVSATVYSGHQAALGDIVGEALSNFKYLLPLQDILLYVDFQSGFWVSFTVTGITLLGLLGAFLMFVRSGRRAIASSAEDELQVRRLLLQYGQEDSLGYFATRRDKSAIFSEDRKAAIAYGLFGSVLIASGDPIGELASWEAAGRAWLALAREHGWTPAVVGCSNAGVALYRKLGLTNIPFGDEAVVTVDSFSLSNPELRELARVVRKAERENYSVSVRRLADIPADELKELTRLVDVWRNDGPERGFSMASNRFGDPTDRRTVIVLAKDSEDKPQGILSFIPVGNRMLSLDVMRRNPNSMNGTTSFMIVKLIEECREIGLQKVGLNFAVMRRVFAAGEQAQATSVERAARRVMLIFSRWYQFESLYRSNEIYLPEWKPRWLCLDKGASPTETILAMGQAEGFVPVNVLGRFRKFFIKRMTPEQEKWWTSPDFIAQVRADEESYAKNVVQMGLPQAHLSGEMKARLKKLDRLRELGIDPYPLVSEPQGLAITVLRQQIEGEIYSSYGRIMRIRDHGGLVFVDLREGTSEIQLLLERQMENFSVWKSCISRGDLIAVRGLLMRTGTGELSLKLKSWRLLAKCLVAMPDKRFGLTDFETKVRRREVDIASSGAAFDMVRHRSAILSSIRDTFRARSYIEVETPMLQLVHGGANARPFQTYSNAYNIGLSLRIAPELFLKRLLAGGVDKIFEMGRNFRNEGTSFKHNPEFTSVEAYEFFTDYVYQMALTREVIVNAAIAVHGRPIAIRPDGTELDIGGEWRAIPIHQAVAEALDLEINSETPLERLQEICHDKGLEISQEDSAADLVMELYDEFVEGQTDAPTFYTDMPVEASPLVRPHRQNPKLTEKWDLVIFGMELGTGSTELCDPVEQRLRLTEQSMAAAAGDPEAMEIDEAFLSAVEFGIKPLGGLGIGVDRLVMTLTGGNIRQTLAFPFARPK